MPSLLSPLKLGDIDLAHRVVMAPLTRMRARQPGNTPAELNVEYYRQRASVGGLIITEATQISPTGQGFPATPGIYSAEQVAAWRRVTDAVHANGGRIVLQLWHVGRISHSSHLPNGRRPVAPSPLRPAGNALNSNWQRVPFETPHELSIGEIWETIEDYRLAASNALKANFDGVEIHGANGYLLDQFLQDGTNQRSDRYGGSIENRSRLLLEVVDAAIAIWGNGRVGVRLSPFGSYADIRDSNPEALFTDVIGKLSSRQSAYLHLIEPRASGVTGSDDLNHAAPLTSSIFRSAFNGPLIAAGCFTKATAEAAIESGLADAVAFGRLFLANPDLPRRFEVDGPLSPHDRSTFYGGGEAGYTDYTKLDR
ncbi:alkene reductase [Bradyrhizobium sp. B120]|uniref:alkene reductase n=1 Tax=Bradyrhizobium sp. B120 TaxID=3410088 RepID=UPI003B986DEC